MMPILVKSDDVGRGRRRFVTGGYGQDRRQWVNNLYGFWENFSYRTQQLVSSRQDSAILPRQVANDSAGLL